MELVFFGNEKLATGIEPEAITLQKLIASGYKISAIVINQTSQKVGKNNPNSSILNIAIKNKITVLSPKRILDIKQELAKLNAKIGILVSFGKIIPQEIIDLFPLGIVNIHPSLLPKHRGSTPIESFMLSEEKTTGVSLMKLVKEMDAGPIYSYSPMTPVEKISKQDLAINLLDIGSSMLIELLPGIISNNIIPQVQDAPSATYDSLINKQDGRINWQKDSSMIEKEIRAYYGWPGSYTSINNLDIIIKKVKTVSESGSPGTYKYDKKTLIIFCKKGGISIQVLQPIGKKEMPIEAFLAGYKI